MIRCKPLHICFYISDHGFGHAMRCVPIMEELLTRGARITAVCGARQISVIHADLGDENISYRTEKMDVGLVLHSGTLLVESKRLYEETSAYLSDRGQRAVKEASWLIDSKVDIACCDMPLWSIEAYQLAGVAMQYLGNFTWTSCTVSIFQVKYGRHTEKNISASSMQCFTPHTTRRYWNSCRMRR